MAETIAYIPYTNSKADTDQCALFANDLLRNLGYKSYGNAWNRTGKIIYNGYDHTQAPEDTTQGHLIHGRLAAQDVYKNFDANNLNKNLLYTVNMYYKGSPYIDEAYSDTDNNSIRGTHTGNLYWDGHQWMVEHNIHGTVLHEPFISLQRQNRNYGVTAIQQPRKKIFGLFENGGLLTYFDYLQI